MAKKIKLTVGDLKQLKLGLKVLESISINVESQEKWRTLHNKLDDGVVFVKRRKKYPDDYLKEME